jgi:hypothetical protein
MDENTLAKQLSTYADSFTGFSFVQGAAFCFLIVQSVPFACALRSNWCVAESLLFIAGACYIWLLRRCHRGEDDLIGVPANRGERIGKVVPVVRKVRFLLVVISTLGEMAIVVGARFFSHAMARACTP